MPIYEYQCSQGHVTEQLELLSQNMKEITCPQCQQVAAKIVSRSSWKFGGVDNGIRVETTTKGDW